MYRHTQIGWLILMALGIGILLTGYFGGINPNWSLWLVFSLLTFCIVLFTTLTVFINGNSIEIRFGPGLIKKKIFLEEIASCRVVKNHWWHGWGIRKISKGWLFNVSGLDAVELSMRNGKAYRIGTDEPQKLSDFIQGRLNK